MNKKFTKLMAALALLVFMTPSMAGWGQTKDDPITIYSENFGTPSSNTNISDYTGWSALSSMFNLTGNETVSSCYSGNKVGTGEASTTTDYSAASGSGNAFQQGTANTTTTILTVQKINISGKSSLSLNFAIRNGGAASYVKAYYQIDNGSETELTLSGYGNGTGWYYVSSTISGTGTNLKLVFKQTPTKGWTTRIDDILLTGIVSSTDPSINADNVNITYNATGGNIDYTVNNAVSGGTLTAAIKEGTIPTITSFAVGTVTGTTVPFTCAANTITSEKTATVTLTYTYNTNETVTKDVTVTQAAMPTYTVTYNANGASGIVPTDETQYTPLNHTVTVLGNIGSPALAKTGYSWSGWCLNAEGNGTVYGPDYTTTYPITANTTFYAKWTKNQYNVALSSNDKATLTATYETNNTINEGGNANVDYGTVITLNATGMTTGAECVWQIKKASDNTDVTSSVLSNGNKLTVPDYAVIIDASISTKAVYTITSTSTVSSSGALPSESTATFSQTYNTAKQMTAGNSMTLTLSGYEGQMIKAITLSMKSNSGGGAGYMTAIAGTTTIGSIASEADPKDFNDAVWNGSYSTSYVNITVPIANPDNVVLSDLVIYIKATANSLYCESFTIYYETSTDPIVALTPSSLSTTYEGHTNVSGFTVQSLNITNPSYSLVYCDAEGNTITQPDWFTATLDGTSVKYTTSQNDGPDRYAYFKIYESNENVYSDVISFRQVRKLATYKLVSSIEPGKHYIFASAKEQGTGYGMSSQGANNRSAIPVAITTDGDDKIISEDADGFLHEFVISGNGTNPNYYTIYDVNDAKYLYAASSSDNYLRSQETNDDNGKWTASFSSGGAVTFTAQGTNTNKKLYYNSGNKIFSCYSNAQQDVYLYVKVNDTNYEFYSNTTLASATIADNETYTVHSPAALKVTGTLTNNIAANLIIEDGGQLDHSNTGVFATMQKGITAHGETVADGGFYFISAPMTSLTIDNTEHTNILSNSDLYIFDQTRELEWQNYKKNNTENHTTFTTLDEGKGYLYANDNTFTALFMGELAYSDGVVPVSYSTANTDENMHGWNLIGNPFACNAYLTQSYYGIDPEGGRNVVARTSAVAPCEGVMVQAANNQTSVIFSKTAPQSGSGASLQMTIGQQVMNRDGVSSTAIDNAIVSFNEGNELPKFYFMEQNANLYIPQGEKEYAIATSEGQGEMPLNFRANTDGQYVLTVNPEGVEMNYLHLIDNMTGNDIDLLQTPSYSFNAKTTDYESRFRLVFAANNENGVSAGSTTFAFYSNGNWMVNNEGEATLQVIDVMGRVLSSQTISGTAELNLNQQAGVYVLRLVNGNDVKTQKIVVK